MKNKPAFLSLLFSFLFTTTIFAVSASAFNLPDTGQTKCYQSVSPYAEIPCAGTGQDGAYNINLLSYTDNGSETVTDNNTGLVWQKEDDGQIYNWYEATGSYDAQYNPSSKNICEELTIGGLTGWRLPSNSELLSLVNYNTPDPGPAIDPIFTNTKPLSYWSSTALAENPIAAFNVHFGAGGNFLYSKGSKIYVRCVQPGGFPSQNYTDNADGTVTDNSTGLMWQQSEPGAMSWTSALSYCENLELPSGSGQTDWRLPNIKELESITDYTRYNPAINTDFFPDTYLHSYWSSTTMTTSSNIAWAVGFRGGGVGHGVKEVNVYVRCVRGGEEVEKFFAYPMDKWNLGTYYFGYSPWLGEYCKTKVKEGKKIRTYKYPKVHTGVDVNVGKSNIGKEVKASAKGLIKGACYDPKWAYALVIEHDQDGKEETPDDKITTVYWHININPDLGIAIPRRKGCKTVYPEISVDQGDPIGNIANLRANSHLHFGIRFAPFDVNLSAKGALPSEACGGNPAFPNYFDDPQLYLTE